jgi:hypothetical protein
MLWYLELSGQAYDNVGDEECIGDVGGEVWRKELLGRPS